MANVEWAVLGCLLLMVFPWGSCGPPWGRLQCPATSMVLWALGSGRGLRVANWQVWVVQTSWSTGYALVAMKQYCRERLSGGQQWERLWCDYHPALAHQHALFNCSMEAQDFPLSKRRRAPENRLHGRPAACELSVLHAEHAYAQLPPQRHPACWCTCGRLSVRTQNADLNLQLDCC